MSYTQKKKFCPTDNCHVHLPQSSSICFREHLYLFPPPWSLFCHWPLGQSLSLGFLLSLVTIPFLLPFGSSSSHCQMMLFSLGCHPRSSSVDNCCFAPALNHHLYMPITAQLIHSQLGLSSGSSAFNFQMDVFIWMFATPLSWVHQKMKEAFLPQSCFSSWSSCLRACAWESHVWILARLLNLFFLPYHIG